MKIIPRQYRQGDVLLHPIASLPAGVESTPVEEPIVLAEGELTGHAHRIENTASARRYVLGEQTYIEVIEPVALTHETHLSLMVEPGIYEVRRQIETWHDRARLVCD
jgi:hypothetical protein